MDNALVHQCIRKTLGEVHGLCKLGLFNKDANRFVYGRDYVVGSSPFLREGSSISKESKDLMFPPRIKDGQLPSLFVYVFS